MSTLATPTSAATHRGADDLPFVDIGGGNKLKVIQVDAGLGLWIVENVFQPGYAVPDPPPHRARLRLHHLRRVAVPRVPEYVNRAGSFLYEPAGSVHTLECLEDDTHVWFQMYGVEPEPRRRRQRRERLRRSGHARGVLPGSGRGGGVRPPERPRGMNAVESPTLRLADPATFVDGVPHEAIDRALRERTPVAWQDMDGEPGFWAVLRHADVVKVAREPDAVLARARAGSCSRTSPEDRWR